MRENYQANWKIYNTIFIIIAVLVSVPNIFATKSAGLDPSWGHAINKFFNEGYIFGKDIVFTYGPLGFLTHCENEGNNILIAGIVWFALLVCHSFLLYQLLFKLKCGKDGLSVVLSFVIYAVANIQLKEYYFCYIAVLSIMLIMNGYKKNVYVFDAILMISLYIKFSLFIMMVAITLIYLIFGYFHNKKVFKYCSIRICTGILLTPFIYFFIDGFSLTNFKNYIKGSIEIASGYNVAMSMVGLNDIYLVWILIAITAFAACSLMSLKSGLYNFMTLAYVGTCLFMCYKHGFTRADMHVQLAMNGMLLFLSIIPVFLDWDKIRQSIGKWTKIYVGMIALVISIAMVQNGLDSLNLLNQIREKVFNLPLTLATVFIQNDTEVNPLPQNISSEIGHSTVSIYPEEISYCVSNDLNYVPLTAVQAYSIYTPYLDEITAEKFLKEDAPEYILFSMNVIDNRWPFVECPRTWEAIRNNYYIKLQENDLFLLKRRTDINHITYQMLKAGTYNSEDIIELGDADYLKISTRLSLKGKFAKLFWKIPEVNMCVRYADGTEETRRVLFDMFSNGVKLGSLVNNQEALIDLLNDKGFLSRVSSISFEGRGIKYYDDTISVEFFTTSSEGLVYPNETIKTAYANEITGVDFSTVTVVENSINYNIDNVVGNNNYKRIDGWAYITDTSQNAEYGEICVECNGKYYKCNRISRPDVKDAYGLSTDAVGFSALIEQSDFENICIIDLENQVIFK